MSPSRIKANSKSNSSKPQLEPSTSQQHPYGPYGKGPECEAVVVVVNHIDGVPTTSDHRAVRAQGLS